MQVSPAAHEGVHVATPQTPALHVMPLAQRMPHIPQLLGFVVVSAQLPEQQVCAALHAAPVPQWQAPSAPQVSSAEHAGVHAAISHAPATQT